MPRIYSIEYSGTLWFFYIFARWLFPNSAALRAFAMWMHCDTVVASVEQNTFKLAALTDVKRAQCLCARVRVRCECDTACVCVQSVSSLLSIQYVAVAFAVVLLLSHW